MDDRCFIDCLKQNLTIVAILLEEVSNKKSTVFIHNYIYYQYKKKYLNTKSNLCFLKFLCKKFIRFKLIYRKM